MKKKDTEDEELKNAGYSEFANKELKDIPMEDLDAKLKEFNIGFGNWVNIIKYVTKRFNRIKRDFKRKTNSSN